MSETLRVEIDVYEALRILRQLSPKAMQNAWRRSLRKTHVWIKGQVAKAVSKNSKIPQKVLRSRIYFFLKSYDTGKVWLGLNAVEAERLGYPRQTRTGITAGRFRFQSAWVMKRVAPDGPVYRRTGKARLPYERVKYDWADAGESAFRSVATLAEQRLLTILKQEVNYEIQKAIGSAR